MNGASVQQRHSIAVTRLGQRNRSSRMAILPLHFLSLFFFETPAKPAHLFVYGLARVFQMCREHRHGLFDIVYSLEEAYKLVGVRPKDFTVCLYPPSLLARLSL